MKERIEGFVPELRVKDHKTKGGVLSGGLRFLRGLRRAVKRELQAEGRGPTPRKDERYGIHAKKARQRYGIHAKKKRADKTRYTRKKEATKKRDNAKTRVSRQTPRKRGPFTPRERTSTRKRDSSLNTKKAGFLDKHQESGFPR